MIRLVALLLLTGPRAALAADLVLHAGEDPAIVSARVAAAAGVPVADLRPTALAELVASRPPVLRGGGQATPCAGAPTALADVAETLQTVESDILFLDYTRAVADADVAMQRLGCLREPVDGAVASRILFLRGVASFYAGDEAGALMAFRQAHLFQPGLQWDANYAAEPQAVFERALVELASGSSAALEVIPGPSVVPVFVDGRRVTRRVSIAAGDHVVQVGTGAVITTRIRLSPGDEATLVVPGALDASALGWALDTEKRGALQGALAAVIGEGFQVYVVAGEEVLRHTTGEDAWVSVRAAAPIDPPPRDPSPPPVDPVEPDPGPGPTDPTVAREPRRLWWLLPPGVGAIAFGGGYGTHAWLQARKVHKAAGEATDRTEYDALTADYARWGRRLTTAEIVGGIGVAVTVAGLAVKVDGAELAPLLGPDTVGVGLRVRR